MVKSCGSDGVIKKAKIHKKEQYVTDFTRLRARCGDKRKGCGWFRRAKTEIFGCKRKCHWCLKGVGVLTK